MRQGNNGEQQGNKASQQKKKKNVKRKNNKKLKLKLKCTMNMIHNPFMQFLKVCKKEPLGCNGSNLTISFHGN